MSITQTQSELREIINLKDDPQHIKMLLEDLKEILSKIICLYLSQQDSVTLSIQNNTIASEIKYYRHFYDEYSINYSVNIDCLDKQKAQHYNISIYNVLYYWALSDPISFKDRLYDFMQGMTEQNKLIARSLKPQIDLILKDFVKYDTKPSMIASIKERGFVEILSKFRQQTNVSNQMKGFGGSNELRQPMFLGILAYFKMIALGTENWPYKLNDLYMKIFANSIPFTITSLYGELLTEKVTKTFALPDVFQYGFFSHATKTDHYNTEKFGSSKKGLMGKADALTGVFYSPSAIAIITINESKGSGKGKQKTGGNSVLYVKPRLFLGSPFVFYEKVSNNMLRLNLEITFDKQKVGSLEMATEFVQKVKKEFMPLFASIPEHPFLFTCDFLNYFLIMRYYLFPNGNIDLNEPVTQFDLRTQAQSPSKLLIKPLLLEEFEHDFAKIITLAGFDTNEMFVQNFEIMPISQSPKFLPAFKLGTDDYAFTIPINLSVEILFEKMKKWLMRGFFIPILFWLETCLQRISSEAMKKKKEDTDADSEDAEEITIGVESRGKTKYATELQDSFICTMTNRFETIPYGFILYYPRLTLLPDIKNILTCEWSPIVLVFENENSNVYLLKLNGTRFLPAEFAYIKSLVNLPCDLQDHPKFALHNWIVFEEPIVKVHVVFTSQIFKKIHDKSREIWQNFNTMRDSMFKLS
jgi:hypothetical protein